MRRSATLAAASVLALGLWAGGARLGNAQTTTADVDGSGLHLHASVDRIGVAPPGDRTPSYLMTFSHATQVSGNYSVAVTGVPIISGSAVAGFLLGCGISTAGGVQVGIEPNQALTAGITPSLTINSPSNAAARRIGSNPPAASPAPATSAAATTSPTPTTSAAATTSPTPTASAAAAAAPAPTTSAAATTSPAPTTRAAATTAPAPTTSAAPNASPAPTTSSAPTASAAATTSAAPTASAAATTSAAPTTSAAATTSSAPTTSAAETTTPTPTTTSPPTNSSSSAVGIAPNVAGLLGVQEVLQATIAPGQVTTATTATAALDNNTRFPYHLTFSNAAVNVAQCASPVEAVPFVTTTVATPQGSVQTTAYGNKFTF
ncbi:MspA family porin [Nocardia jiangxiensis]|uniref:MspA family porin n=1 Tax=Nocardia jiangxiensis TaxID=282685 RepID=A0ABW6S4C1_9NOCA